MQGYLSAAVLALTLSVSSFAWAQEKLIMVGGGKRPAKAVKLFSKWSNASSGRVLIIAWASQYPLEAVAGFKGDLAPHFRGVVDSSLVAPKTELEAQRFLKQLDLASGVFFTGGDQARIMAGLSHPGSEKIKLALDKKYNHGTVFGGTSAGTAIMSSNMITGGENDEDVTVAEGLGYGHRSVFPIVIDQHFTQRQREKRLAGAMRIANLRHGIGIDEDTALVLENRELATVIGPHRVRTFEERGGTMTEISLSHGQSFNIITWKKERRSTVEPAEVATYQVR